MGRNVVRGPDFVNVDFSVAKTFTFESRLNLELRGEFFNILNHPNFAGVDGDVSDTLLLVRRNTRRMSLLRIQSSDLEAPAHPGRSQAPLVVHW